MVASPADVERVTEMLGRPPRAEFEVVVRSAAGEPAVIRNAPLLADGTPMPTRYWLVAPDLVRAVSRLEADGGVRAAEAAVDPEALAAAHAAYASDRERRAAGNLDRSPPVRGRRRDPPGREVPARPLRLVPRRWAPTRSAPGWTDAHRGLR